jgi:hypothetical protein
MILRSVVFYRSLKGLRSRRFPLGNIEGDVAERFKLAAVLLCKSF